MIKRFYIMGFLLTLFATLIILGAKKTELKITKPENGERITVRKIVVEGTSEGLDSGTTLTIYVKTNKVYEQGSTEIRQDGTWQFYPAVIGAEEDRDFYAEIFAKTESGIISNTVTIYRIR